MTRRHFSNLLLGSTLPFAPARAAEAPPFRLEVSEDVSDRFPGAPRLHSFAWGQWKGRWIFFAGRTGGYHGIGGADADFVRAKANNRIWVVEPRGDRPARTSSFPVTDLPDALAPVRDQLLSTNPQFVQDGSTLYLAGGYGQNASGAWVTHATLTAVDLSAIVEALTAGTSPAGAFAFSETDLVQATGAGLIQLDDGMFYQFGGHVFMGTYREFEAAGEKNTPAVWQRYSSEIRKLSIERDSSGRPHAALVSSFRHPEFARRDLNVVHTLEPDGKTLAAAAYGGVFTEEQLNFERPIYWTSGLEPAIHPYEQKMSAYSCATLLAFDHDARTMHTTFFGGISRWSWDFRTNQFALAPRTGEKTDAIYQDGLAWIDAVTTLSRSPKRTCERVHSEARLPGYLGSNAAFLLADELPLMRSDAPILNLSALRGQRTLVGYLYGGIQAFPREFPYGDDAPLYRSGNAPTLASDRVLVVYLTA